MKQQKRTVFCAVMLILALTVLMSGCRKREGASSSSSSSAPTESSSTSSVVPEVPETVLPGESVPTVDRESAFADAKAKNADTVAWLYIPGADVDDPVMQAEDNAYYLHLDENENYSAWGCYYADCRSKLGKRGSLKPNTVIYGHSANDCDAENGQRFTRLHRYMDAEFVEEHPYIHLFTGKEDLIFQIAACFITDVSFDYINPDPVGDGLSDFFESVEKKNWLDVEGVTLSEEDRILTLSTCCTEFDTNQTGNQRLVIMAKLLPENAAAQDVRVSPVSSPEMP